MPGPGIAGDQDSQRQAHNIDRFGWHPPPRFQKELANDRIEVLTSTKPLPRFRPDSPKIPFFCPAADTPWRLIPLSGRANGEIAKMIIKASGRSALILATGLFVCFAAGPSQAAPASADNAAANARSGDAAGAPVALNKYADHAAHHGKTYAHHKSGQEALKAATGNKTAASGADDGNNSSASTIPTSVANANAELPSADTPTRNAAKAMSARANDLLQNAPDNPADAQPAAETQVVSADQLNEVDRALHEGAPAAPSQAMASAEPPVAPVMASSSGESSTWDQTSLIGKIFIGFGALLTMASAARMFMA
jgi:hypothetical protein